MSISRSSFVSALVLIASSALAQSDSPGLSTAYLDDWLTRLNDAVSSSANLPSPMLVDILFELDAKVNSPLTIQSFRVWAHDDDAVKALIPIAAGAFPQTRVPATYILGNVVDNTNVCYVIGYLQGNSSANVNGRYNLLQVVLQVSSYAFSDTGGWINQLVQQNLQATRSGPTLGKTNDLLQAINRVLQTRKIGINDSLRATVPGKYQACVKSLGTTLPDSPPAPTPTFNQSINQITPDVIRATFAGPQRTSYSDYLTEVYKTASPADQDALVKALTNSVNTSQGDLDPDSRYYVNLYTTLTLSKLPLSGENLTNAKSVATVLMNTPEKGDSTFRQALDSMLSKQEAK